VSTAATIGVLGGGQLGRMLTLEAKSMGYRVVTLEPQPDSPTGQVADDQIVAAYDDLHAIAELGARSDVVTYEFENIPLQGVVALEEQRRIVRPSAAVLRVTQDRLLEKAFINEAGGTTTPFRAVRDEADLNAAIASIGFPAVIKTAAGGYDGKGQWTVRDGAAARRAFEGAGGAVLIYEAFAEFDCEASIICVRGVDGQHVVFPVTENQHDAGILVTSIVPARIPERAAKSIRDTAVLLGDALGIVGAYCVEFFVANDSGVLVNEIAPRVHNSGHYSLDATQISQYEAHVRAICELPLVEPRLFAPAAMMNILGAGTGDRLTGLVQALRDPDLRLHLYGKRHAALRRKMGHFTVLGSSVEDALERATLAKAALQWN
jgi:5-(carboxyamino)imidazole ribonucleotide synthase